MIFTADQFAPTKWDTAEDKARFANQFVRFVESDFAWAEFPKWFYVRLSMCRSHIAHFNQHHFYTKWFTASTDEQAFLQRWRDFPIFGDPEYTYSDVEHALQQWLRASVRSAGRSRSSRGRSARHRHAGETAARDVRTATKITKLRNMTVERGCTPHEAATAQSIINDLERGITESRAASDPQQAPCLNVDLHCDACGAAIDERVPGFPEHGLCRCWRTTCANCHRPRQDHAWRCQTCAREGIGAPPDRCPHCLSERDVDHGPRAGTQ